MATFETLLLLVLALVAMEGVAARLPLPGPVLLIAAGWLVGEIPGLGGLSLPPELVFAIFVPPLIYSAAYYSSWRELLQNIEPILLLAVALVLATMAAVAAAAHAWFGFGWPLAFVLGAVLAPSDTVAILAVLRTVSLSRHVTTILEGESLFNDATALLCFQLAVAAVVSGHENWGGTLERLPLVVLVGPLLGLAIAWAYVRVRRWIQEPRLDAALSLVVPYGTFLIAQAIGSSGVLAVLALGIYDGWFLPTLHDAEVRLQTLPLWNTLEFLLSGLVFMIMGLSLHGVFGALNAPWSRVLWQGAIAIAVVLGIRVPWVFGTAWLVRRAEDSPGPFPAREVALVSLSGLRGVDTLVTALALPFVIATGAPFPQRALIVTLALGVVLGTLLLGGLSLPWLVERWRLGAEESRAIAESRARIAAARAALRRLDDLEEPGTPLADTGMVTRLRQHFEAQLQRGEMVLRPNPDGRFLSNLNAYHDLLHEALEAQRATYVRLRNEGAISGEVLERLQREVDMEELHHHHGRH
ncbi:MAG TPA: Na+/H+ antiporter [Oscillatoriaceae cyanobacterium]